MSLAAPDLGPFALGPKIGGGGMAAVYLGKYVAAPGEETPEAQSVVALKVIKGELVQNPEYEKMFLDEAELLTRLSHPNVIRTVGYGAQAGAWFIAMELLMGRSLLDVWEEAAKKKLPIPFDVAAHVAREVARGLEHAHGLVDEDDGHALAIVHRDVNPSNVFVSYDGSVKLIDFGLAKARKRQTQSTRGLIKGKIPYLSPEQIKEDSLDGRSDVYALGTTLWETVTMRRLFKRDTDVATVRAIQKGEVPDPRAFVEGFPDALWPIVEKSLRQNRDERYASAGAMADDLDRFLAKSTPAELGRELARLVDELFPGEAEKQEAWLAEAVGRSAGGTPRSPTENERKTLAPIVPIAEVPEVENSMPVLAPPPPDSDPEPEPEPDPDPEAATATATDPPPARRTGGVAIYALVGALAGAAAVAAWVALR